MNFFKEWKKNAAEYAELQKELKAVMAKRGISFMHLHPKITKCLVRISRTKGAEGAVEWLESTMETLSYMNLSDKEISEQLVRACKKWNQTAKNK